MKKRVAAAILDEMALMVRGGMTPLEALDTLLAHPKNASQ
jgi:hypothetical protein